MRRVLSRGRKKPARTSPTRFEALEVRQLLSSDLLTGPTFAPIDIVKANLTPAQVAALPKGYTLNIPSNSPRGGGGGINPQLSGGYTPAQVRHAYGIDQLPENGAGQTIAIVDAYDDPTIVTDLAAFDAQFGLPAANFVKAEPQGVPQVDADWDGEISLDVEWAHAIAPAAKIVLVEALDASDNLYSAVQYAEGIGASQISMSWGSDESVGDGEQSNDSIFNNPGISFFASAGDSASELVYPSESPYVTAVGGTSLYLNAQGTKQSETAWNSGGGGPSLVEPEPPFQVGFNSSSVRTSPDVAYNADPDTGVYTVDNGEFDVVGGTSAGAPQWAALAALANQGRVTQGETPLGTGLTYGTNIILYDLAGKTGYTNPNSDYSDVASGSNGHPATTGYDLATGLGSPIATNLIPDLINIFSEKAPTIVSPAAAAPSTVMGKTTQLSVLATDALGASTLHYTWTTSTAPAGATTPTFAINGTNASNYDTATFYQAGNYTLTVRAVDPNGLSVSSSVDVTVVSVPTSLGISPTALQLSPNQFEQFSAPGLDQFGKAIGNSSLALTWTLTSGGGTLSSTGAYTAPATGTTAVVTVSSGGLRSSATVYILTTPWTQTDLGGTVVTGYSSDNGSGTYSVLGAGTGVSGTSDQGQFASLPLTGNSTIQADVAAIGNSGKGAEAGVTYRLDNTPGSPNVTIAITPNNGLTFSYRVAENGNTITTNSARVTPGYYVKLVRVGNLFTGYDSPNGTSWTVVGTANLALGGTAEGGLIAASGVASALGISTFSHVLADSTPTIVVAASASPNPVTGTTTTLSVLGGDAAGESALTYTWTVTALPAGAVAPIFATNGTNAAKTDLVTFSKAGSYSFQVVAANALGYSVTSSTSVTVVATATTVSLTPKSPIVLVNQSLQLTAQVLDQFGLKMSSQPRFTFSLIAGGVGGKISSSGLYTAPNRTGTDIVNVTTPTSASTVKITVIQGISNQGLAVSKSATVSGVSVGWGTESAPLSTTADGLRLLPAGRRVDLPWAGINSVTVSLSQGEPLVASDVSVTGLTVANYGPVTVTAVPGVSGRYVIGLSRAISSADRVALTISSSNVTTYRRELDVLPGDVNDDGVVDASDTALATNSLLTTSVSADLLGQGKVTVESVKKIALLNGTTLPV